MIAALFVRADSIYKTIPGVDAWDAERDARRWPGGTPAVYHPPCRAWGVFSWRAKPREGERECATWAVDQVRRHGGVIEHPAGSKLWAEAGLPEPGQRDAWGGGGRFQSISTGGATAPARARACTSSVASLATSR